MRFTLYRGRSAPVEDPAAEIKAVGGSVISARPGLALIEASDAAAERLRDRLKDWRITPETRATQDPPRVKLPRG